MNSITAFAPIATPYSTVSVSSLCMVARPEVSASRRLFVQKSGLATSAAFFGFFVNFDGHSPNCNCADCGGSDSHSQGCACGSCRDADGHELGCQCHGCMNFRPLVANAAYERDVGGNGRSPETYAMNLQAKETNARLEKSGFKLDTKEEESARLSEAFSSFSYDSVASKGQKSNAGKGYGNKSESKTSVSK